ncbi:MAG: UDP-N-acetylmuramoyl-tripeptide--D-alanyl-D-alanine ligase [Sandaracinaceae bacterium]|nr:UDP-N-acetylmuramoyl-tripeptide--D-alanyl-D-alanine ligase [Sandaracinaceae bacterium]
MATPLPDNDAVFSAAELRSATSALEQVAAPVPVRGVTTDSRRVREGSLFVALRGAQHDGHDFLPQAFAAGAGAVLVEHAFLDRAAAAPEGTGVYAVQDTLTALGDLAAFHRRRFSLPLVAITGSVGKTSTKDLVAAALAGLGRRVLRTAGNLNNRVGLPMTLLTLRSEHDAAVIEMGMSVPGEIAELARIAAPTVGVVTAVAEAHLEGLGGLEGVAREKGALLLALGEDAVAIWCADYAAIEPYAERSSAKRKLCYGLREGADVRLARFELEASPATRCRYEVCGHPLELTLAQLGEGAAVNVAGALAVLLALGEEREGALDALAKAPAVPGRMVPVALANDVLALDDSYNASPRSVTGALETSAALADARGGRLIAVLGDMLELGAESRALHEQVGREVVRARAKVLVACGEQMTHAGRAALAATMERPRGERTRVVIVKEPAAAADCAKHELEPRDVLLVKGSRGMRMERVIDALAGEQV